MSTTTQTDPRHDLAAAREALEALVERIAEGDETVLPEDLHQAESTLRFHQTRIDHLAAVQARRQAEADAARLAEIATELQEMTEASRAPALLAKAATALDAYLAAAQEHNAHHSDLWSEVSQIASLGGRGGSAESGSGTIRIGGATYRQVTPKLDVETITLESWKKHFPRSAPPGDRASR